MMMIDAQNGTGLEGGRRSSVLNGSGARAKVVAINSPRGGAKLVQPVARARLIGRKGRQALVRRRALDGALLSVALGVVALLCWRAL